MSSFRPSPSPSLSSTTISTDRKGSWTSQSRNPVSLRLYKVLGTNFDDDATREALQTLSDLYATPGPSKGKETHRATSDVDEGNDEEWIKATATHEVLPESVPGESAARARKNLRRDMELKLAEGSRQFLKAFGEVDQVCLLVLYVVEELYLCILIPQKLDELQEHIGAMRASCDEAEKQLQLTNEASKELLERAGHLREERFAL